MWKTIVLLTCLLGTASVWGQVSVISVTDEDKHTRKEDFYHTFEYYITPTGEKAASFSKCQATRIGRRWFATAAHCVQQPCQNGCLIQMDLLEQPVSALARVTHTAKKPAVFVHPGFSAQKMVKNDFAIGGEQSGHIINKHHGLFGDGLKTAMNILAVIKESNQSIEELCEDVKIYPQLLINQRVKDKNIVLNDDEIKKLIDKIAKELGSDGRILVRPSGTEPLIRVMVEADSKEKCHDLVYQVIDLINAKGYGE